jgi:hypothetical protein
MKEEGIKEMVETQVTHFISWDEIFVLISEYVSEKYKIEIPESAQIRVLNKRDGMVQPDRIRIKYEKEIN